MDLGEYLAEKTGLSKAEFGVNSRKENTDWAREYSKIIESLLVGAGVAAFDDSYFYKITGVEECGGYICIKNKVDGSIRLSAILSDWIERFPESKIAGGLTQNKNI